MTLPKLSKPPLTGNQEFDRWANLMYHWIGQASGASPLKSANITEALDVSFQVTGEMDANNLVPNAQPNVTNFATVDSIDGGGTATIRVYGAGGVATPWTRRVGTVEEGPFPSATLPGYPYEAIRDVYYRASNNDFLVIDTSTDFTSSLDPDLRWVGQLKTLKADGTGAIAGGGGSTGGVGGGRYANRLALTL